jgi:murein DD-endopeptidase MepM/ murein hydrolase activator NlpD
VPKSKRPPGWYVVASRVRGVATVAGFLLIVVGVVGELAFDDADLGFASLAGFVLLVVGIALTLVPYAPDIAARPVASPVTGRWSALNSPARKVPSHSTHGYGQTFAIDLVYEPADGARPRFGAGPAFRPPTDFPAFGRPVVAPAAGRVVSVRTSARDHRSRSTWAAFAYMMIEGMIRELGGSRPVIGNFVIIELEDGAYATIAHMQRGSANVRPGDPVRAGQVIGRCGNTGNSSEPHVHFQLTDHRIPYVAAGLPFEFSDVSIDGGAPGDGVPRDEQIMEAVEGRFVVG